ncbi:putative exported domain protein [Chlamydia psittaci CP3]|nr:putative exported domain protein [Chlamydia psittaci CP3]
MGRTHRIALYKSMQASFSGNFLSYPSSDYYLRNHRIYQNER